MKKHYLLISLAIVVCANISLYAQSGLKHSWAFEEDANDQVGDAHGIIEGAAYFDDGGIVTGEDAGVSIPGGLVSISSYNELTVDLWFKSASDQANNNFTMSFYMGGTNGKGVDGFFMSMSRGDDDVAGAFSRVGMSCGEYDAPWDAESKCDYFVDPDDGEMHHAVAVITDSEISYFFDGDLSPDSPVALKENNSLANLSDSLIYVGYGGYHADPHYEGTIYQINIFDKALSENEVLDLYDAGPVAPIVGITQNSVNELKVAYAGANVIELLDVEQVITSELFSVNGQRIRSFNNETMLNLSNVSAGMYVLKVNSAIGVSATKVIVR